MKKYIFDKSQGDGIPGLPHEVTDEEAKALGVFETLQAAIKSGAYVEVKPPKVQKDKE
jgi:hypothetical protein